MAAPSPHPAVIRAVGPADAQALRDLRLEALRLCPAAFTADLAENEARPIEWWRDVAKKAPATAYTRSSSRRRIINSSAWRAWRGPRRRSRPHRADIWGVYVRPEARGKGLGARLVHAAIEWARARGLAMVTLAVIVGNEGARRCYQRAGFTVYGVQPMVVRVDGVFYDELLMMKRL